MPIVSFKCKETQALFEGRRPQRFSNIRTIAERKLQLLDSAETLLFLKAPPGNRLEKLTGDRVSQYSMRINAQWRICFVWTDGGPSASRLSIIIESGLAFWVFEIQAH